MNEVFTVIGLLDAALLLALLIHAFWFQIMRVKGHSMEDTLRTGEVMLVTKPRTYRRGDVVICRYPRRVHRTWNLGPALTLTLHPLFVKRLVALPGDTVEIRDGILYVNGEPAPDPPTMKTKPRDVPFRALGPNQYFVMGDNRSSSHDSRALDVGPLPRNMLKGKARFVLWPLNRWRSIQ